MHVASHDLFNMKLRTCLDTGGSVDVTFNCRYSLHHAKFLELIVDGTIGQVISVHFKCLCEALHDLTIIGSRFVPPRGTYIFSSLKIVLC
jgi:hypothetical protein